MEGKYPNGELLVQTAWLASHRGEPGPRLVDMRPAARYRQGHIRGAVHLLLSQITEGRPGKPSMIPPPEKVERVLGSLGIGGEHRVVIYDDSKGLTASYLFWLLEYYGHKRVSLLDGGFPQWVKEGRETTEEVSQPSPARFAAKVESGRLATKERILSRFGLPETVILDCRSPAEYRGQDVQAQRGGHIPGAINIEWTRVLTGSEASVLKSPEELLALYREAGVTPDREVIIHCQAGVRSSHTYFVLRLLGYPRVANYEPSWQEWGNDPELPITRETA